MKVGILGTGQVEQTLAAGFKKHGHDVKLGHRDPKQSYADAAKFGEVVLLCTPWENAIKLAERSRLLETPGGVVVRRGFQVGLARAGVEAAAQVDYCGHTTRTSSWS